MGFIRCSCRTSHEKSAAPISGIEATACRRRQILRCGVCRALVLPARGRGRGFWWAVAFGAALASREVMKAVVVSWVPPAHVPLAGLVDALDRELARAGYETVAHFALEGLKLGFCQGEFDCWVKTPG